MKKQLISILLAVVMMLTFIPTAAFAQKPEERNVMLGEESEAQLAEMAQRMVLSYAGESMFSALQRQPGEYPEFLNEYYNVAKKQLASDPENCMETALALLGVATPYFEALGAHPDKLTDLKGLFDYIWTDFCGLIDDDNFDLLLVDLAEKVFAYFSQGLDWATPTDLATATDLYDQFKDKILESDDDYEKDSLLIASFGHDERTFLASDCNTVLGIIKANIDHDFELSELGNAFIEAEAKSGFNKSFIDVFTGAALDYLNNVGEEFVSWELLGNCENYLKSIAAAESETDFDYFTEVYATFTDLLLSDIANKQFSNYLIETLWSLALNAESEIGWNVIDPLSIIESYYYVMEQYEKKFSSFDYEFSDSEYLYDLIIETILATRDFEYEKNVDAVFDSIISLIRKNEDDIYDLASLGKSYILALRRQPELNSKLWMFLCLYNSLADDPEITDYALCEIISDAMLAAALQPEEADNLYDFCKNAANFMRLEDADQDLIAWEVSAALKAIAHQPEVRTKCDDAFNAMMTLFFNPEEALRSDLKEANRIYFDSNDYGKQTCSQLVASGACIVMPASPTDANATFAGWYKDSDCTIKWNFDDALAIKDSKMTLYAKWEYGAMSDFEEMLETASYGDLIVLDKSYGFDGQGGEISITTKVALDLNGHRVDAAGYNFVVSESGDLLIKDSEGNGLITGMDAVNPMFCIELKPGSKLTISGGNISGNCAESAVIYNNNATLIMNGGCISDNYCDPEGLFVVPVLNCGTFIMSGGMISGNYGSVAGGVVCVDEPVNWGAGSMYAGGDAVVAGNINIVNGGSDIVCLNTTLELLSGKLLKQGAAFGVSAGTIDQSGDMILAGDANVFPCVQLPKDMNYKEYFRTNALGQLYFEDGVLYCGKISDYECEYHGNLDMDEIAKLNSGVNNVTFLLNRKSVGVYDIEPVRDKNSGEFLGYSLKFTSSSGAVLNGNADEREGNYLAEENGKLVYSPEPFAWEYKKGAFCKTERTESQLLGYTLFGKTIKPSDTVVRTKVYYLSSTVEGASLSQFYVLAQMKLDASYWHHEYSDYEYIGNGQHMRYCLHCGDVQTENCVYDPQTHRCVCGEYDRECVDVDFVTRDYSLKDIKGNEYKVYYTDLNAKADGIEDLNVWVVSYSLNGGRTWILGDKIISSSEFDGCLAKVLDSEGHILTVNVRRLV